MSPDLATLNCQFAIPGAVSIVAGGGGLPRIEIRTPAAAADIYLHGGQITSWTPAATNEDVIFLSDRSRFEDGKAIRGGIPICFPWFRAKADHPQAPAHGLVRTKSWQLTAITREQDAVTVILETTNDETGRKWWPQDFRIAHAITVGASLRLALTVTNTDALPIRFEEALHTYHRVGDIHRARVAGLDGVAFLDNTDGNKRQTQAGDVQIARAMDNAYLDTETRLRLIDPVFKRRIHIAKANSHTTIVWNPWETAAKALADLGDEEWEQFACVEASNILSAAVVLAPGEKHTMTATLEVAQEPL